MEGGRREKSEKKRLIREYANAMRANGARKKNQPNVYLSRISDEPIDYLGF